MPVTDQKYPEIPVSVALAATEFYFDRAGIDFVLPGNPLREAVLYALAGANAITGRGWSLDHARQNVTITLPAVGPAFDLLAMVPYAGPIMAGIAAKLRKTTVFFSNASMLSGLALTATRKHEEGHAGQIKVGGLPWCVMYGLVPEVTAGAEAPCYLCDMAVNVRLGGHDATQVEQGALRSLSAYGADEPLYRGIIGSAGDMLRAPGVDPGGLVAETIEELRRCGWAG